MRVVVSFPGSMSLEQFEDRIQQLHSLGATVHFGEEKMVSPKMKRAADPFTTVTEPLTENEEKLVDLAMSKTHRTGAAPLLEALTMAKVGRLRPNMTVEILDYYRANPGHTKDQGAWFLAEKFIKHYRDINDGFCKIRNIIRIMCNAKSAQHTLEGRGKRYGWNKPVFVIEDAV